MSGGLFAQRLVQAASDEPGSVALREVAGDHLTYERWEADSAAFATGLLERGVGAGQRVLLVYSNAEAVAYAIAFAGVLRAGAVAVPLDRSEPDARIAEVAAHCGAAIAVTAVERTAMPLRAIAHDELARPGAHARLARPLPHVGADAMAQIVYTSGTAGVPKAVVASHGNLVAGHWLGDAPTPTARPRHLLHAMPVGTSPHQSLLARNFTNGHTIVVLDRADPRAFATAVEGFEADVVVAVPTLLLMARRAVPDLSLPSVSLVITSGSSITRDAAETIGALFPRATIETHYSSTESNPAGTVALVDPTAPGRVGRPVPGSALRVVDESGDPCAPGEIGEIWLTTPGAPTRWYLDDPQATAETFRDGWVRMGDLGYVDGVGALHLAGRRTEVVNVGGRKLSVLEIEAAVARHPQVRDVAAYPLPHPVLNEIVAVAIVADGEVSLAELRRFLTGEGESRHLPQALRTVDELPRLRLGKPDKRLLIAQHLAGLGEPAANPTEREHA